MMLEGKRVRYRGMCEDGAHLIDWTRKNDAGRERMIRYLDRRYICELPTDFDWKTRCWKENESDMGYVRNWKNLPNDWTWKYYTRRKD
jgi:hypothetical protein